MKSKQATMATLLFICIFSTQSLGQTQAPDSTHSSDCQKTLAKEIDLQQFTFKIDQFNADLQAAINCGYDLRDYYILVSPQQMFPNRAFDIISDAMKLRNQNDSITFNDFTEAYQNFIKQNNYDSLRTEAQYFINFSNQLASVENWEETLSALHKFGVSGIDINTIHKLASFWGKNRANGYTFGQIMEDIYSKKRKYMLEIGRQNNQSPKDSTSM